MGKIETMRQMQDDLKIGGLVVLIEAAEQQGRIKQADFRVEITMDRGVSLQNN